MKRLLVALVAAVAVSTAFARITVQQGFESGRDGFVAVDSTEDASEAVAYDSAAPSSVPYPFESAGAKFFSLDTGDTTVYCTNTVSGNVYFDMLMQFNPCREAPELEEGTKIAVYLNADNNLVVLSGDGSGGIATNVTDKPLAAGTWGRLTVAAETVSNALQFKVYLDATLVGTYSSLVADTTINSIGFKGTGALDDFVARTTDPYFSNPAVVIGGEGYASIDAAIADDPAATYELKANATLGSAPLAAYGNKISVKLGGHTLSGALTTGLLVPVATTSGDVTTYTASYFPRTDTAGQNGTAANPYEIADVDDIQALKEAFEADSAFRALNYQLVADIDAAGLGYWDGIGVAGKNDADDDTGLAGGTFDGAGHTISNLSFSVDKYRGFFNRMQNATIKDLTIAVTGFASTTEAEHGYAAFVGNMANSTLLRCTAIGTLGTAEAPAMHTTAGLAVRVETSGAFVDCTNYVSVVCSLNDNPKIGGIIGLVQDGSACLTNCYNFGNMTITPKGLQAVGNGAGGLVGYSQGSLTIYGGGNAGTIAWDKTTTADPLNKAAKVGTIIGMEAKSAVVSGGVTAQADAAPAGAIANISGLTFATVDNNIATFVADDALALNGSYKVMSAGKATYQFTTAGTIAFDTTLATPTYDITADTTTLVLTDSTEGNVRTYTAAAGVASVDGVAYATFAEALAKITGDPEKDDFVTLLADNVKATINSAATVKVKADGHPFTPTIDGDFALSTTTEAGITTYTTDVGVAAVALWEDESVRSSYKWFATFDAAYSYAYDAFKGLGDFANNAKWSDIKIKVGADFEPTNITGDTMKFRNITFEATTEDAISIVLTNSTSMFCATESYTFPENATLVAPTSQTVAESGLAKYDYGSYGAATISGGTLELPAYVTLTAYGEKAFDNVVAVSGTGTINAYDADTQSLWLCYPNAEEYTKLPGKLRNEAWNGTLELWGTNDVILTLSDYGNTNSTIRFNGLTTYLKSGTHSVGTVELVGDGLTINGSYSSGTWEFGGALTGSGSLNVAIENTANGTTLKGVQFTGDATEFAGSVAFGENANAYVQFGSTGIGSGEPKAKYILTGDDAVVTVASGKTWTSSAFVLHGNVTLNGDLRALDGTSGLVWNNHPSAVLTVNKAGAFAFGNSETWEGRYVVNYDNAAATNAFVIPQKATTVINGAAGAFYGYPTTGSGAPTNVTGEVVLNANWTIGNGYSGTGKKTTFAKFSGGGNLTTCTRTLSGTVYYEITKLDNYTGVITVSSGTDVKIGGVNVSESPAEGARVVKTATGAVNTDVPLYVDDVDTGKTLTYLADGAEGAGLYLVGDAPTPLEPGEESSEVYETKQAAETAAAGVTIAAADAVKAELTGDALLAAYLANFEAKAVANGEGGYKVVVALTDDAATALKENATDANETVAGSLAEIAADAAGEQTAVAVTGAQPGFYYSISYSTSLKGQETEGDRVMADKDGKVTLKTPAKAANATAGFYKVNVNITAE